MLSRQTPFGVNAFLVLLLAVGTAFLLYVSVFDPRGTWGIVH